MTLSWKFVCLAPTLFPHTKHIYGIEYIIHLLFNPTSARMASWTACLSGRIHLMDPAPSAQRGQDRLHFKEKTHIEKPHYITFISKTIPPFWGFIFSYEDNSFSISKYHSCIRPFDTVWYCCYYWSIKLWLLCFLKNGTKSIPFWRRHWINEWRFNAGYHRLMNSAAQTFLSPEAQLQCMNQLLTSHQRPLLLTRFKLNPNMDM